MNLLPFAIQALQEHCENQPRCATCQFSENGLRCKFFTNPPKDWSPAWGNPIPLQLNFEQTETCPNCDHEVTICWDVRRDGYEAFCPHCGDVLMLCDACQHADDNPTGYCDFKTDFNGTPTCFRRREHNNKTNN